MGIYIEHSTTQSALQLRWSVEHMKRRRRRSNTVREKNNVIIIQKEKKKSQPVIKNTVKCTHTHAGRQVCTQIDRQTDRHPHTPTLKELVGVGGGRGEERKQDAKRWVFRSVLKVDREGLWWTAKGKEFQICTAEKQKAWPPCCFLLKVGMRNVLSLEEERKDLEGT